MPRRNPLIERTSPRQTGTGQNAKTDSKTVGCRFESCLPCQIMLIIKGYVALFVLSFFATRPTGAISVPKYFFVLLLVNIIGLFCAWLRKAKKPLSGLENDRLFCDLRPIDSRGRGNYTPG